MTDKLLSVVYFKLNKVKQLILQIKIKNNLKKLIYQTLDN